jgi:hypothetical protein
LALLVSGAGINYQIESGVVRVGDLREGFGDRIPYAAIGDMGAERTGAVAAGINLYLHASSLSKRLKTFNIPFLPRRYRPAADAMLQLTDGTAGSQGLIKEKHGRCPRFFLPVVA